MKVYTEEEFCAMRTDEYLRAIADMDLEMKRFDMSGSRRPYLILQSRSHISKMLELQQRIAQKHANLKALEVVNDSMMKLMEEG